MQVKTHGKQIEIIEGNKCKKGAEYAQEEVLNPRRVLTSSVIIFGAELPIVSVKTLHPIPKEKIFDALAEIKRIIIKAPVKSGDVIIKNVADTGVDIAATKTVQRKRSL
ncbi:MAG: DUF1667 domain-containing protein [Candidatus Thermoplasmatota archaeon]|nr:DUF1667 domain-containing protein [Candidatus Thermoplasmatota archaeon]